MIRILLVEDQDIFRQGLATLLSVEEDLELVGEASNGREAIQLTEQLQPDVILMDISGNLYRQVLSVIYSKVLLLNKLPQPFVLPIRDILNSI